MTTLHRHQLRRLSAWAWRELLAAGWDDEARACIELWARRDLPLVVTRQRVDLRPGRIALGLPTPDCFSRRRLALEVAIDQTRIHEGFPCPAAITRLLAPTARAPWRALCEALAELRCEARVYGSHGWQALTGLDHLRPGSDIDLLLPVADREQADAVCGRIATSLDGLPRLDGELLFADGAGLAWREWVRHPSFGLLVKRLDGVAIEAAC